MMPLNRLASYVDPGPAAFPVWLCSWWSLIQLNADSKIN